MTELINVNVFPTNEYINVTRMNVHGGISFQISLSQTFLDLLTWTKEHKEMLDKEVKLRNQNPALATQWDHYQTMLRIVMDDV